MSIFGDAFKVVTGVVEVVSSVVSPDPSITERFADQGRQWTELRQEEEWRGLGEDPDGKT